jgi:hypothetical protein
MCDSIFAHHCKFTSTPASHINLGNYSSMSVIFFWHFITAEIQMLRFSGAMKVCPALTPFVKKKKTLLRNLQQDG